MEEFSPYPLERKLTDMTKLEKDTALITMPNSRIHERLNQFITETKKNLTTTDIGDYLGIQFNKMLKFGVFDPLPNGYAYEHIYEEYIGERVDFKKIENNTLEVLGSVDLDSLKVDNYWNKIENYGRDNEEREIVNVYFVEPLKNVAECLIQNRMNYLKKTIQEKEASHMVSSSSILERKEAATAKLKTQPIQKQKLIKDIKR